MPHLSVAPCGLLMLTGNKSLVSEKEWSIFLVLLGVFLQQLLLNITGSKLIA